MKKLFLLLYIIIFVPIGFIAVITFSIVIELIALPSYIMEGLKVSVDSYFEEIKKFKSRWHK